MDYVVMGRRVHKLRVQQGMTQAELAKKLKVSPAFVGHIERGTRATSLETFMALCEVLSTSPSHLMGLGVGQYLSSLPEDTTDPQRRIIGVVLEAALEQIRIEKQRGDEETQAE